MTSRIDYEGKRVTVMGLGRFGGGVGVTRWLCSQGAEVLVTDLDPADKLADSLAAIRGLVDSGRVRLRLGEHNVADFTTGDLIVANVAVPKPWDNRFLRAAAAASIPITTEIAMLIDRLPPGQRERTIAVTGSVGKSTTTAMIHHALTAVAEPGERVLLGGNIGGSLLSSIETFDERTWLVLELSSAMLHWLATTTRPDGMRGWSPRIAVITNISPNHTDWHGSFEHYRACKQALLTAQRPTDSIVLGSSVWDWRSLAPAAANATLIDESAFPRPMKLPGTHNRENAAAALLACQFARPGIDIDALAAAIADFGGLAHRLQLVAEVALGSDDGGEPVRFFNDSKSTTPESCLKAVAALSAMPGYGEHRIHLIAGGYDKGSDLSPIADAASRLGGLYTIGATGRAIAAAANGRAIECGTLADAFAAATKRLQPGDSLLLSPGCASWDQFTNFEQRGDAFVELVKGVTA